ncbi:MAG: beta-Ala-His dipeptidase [Candidatus Hodarchaeota archaeon]
MLRTRTYNRVLSDLEPHEVWNIFEDISRVPRLSQKEEKIRDWVKNWADYNSISWKEDGVGNLLLSKQASAGYGHLPGIILQAHMDMVGQKEPDSSHNFENDPISLEIVNNEYIIAKGTTLGADNGIGMAIALATLTDPSLLHGPLEVLLTVDEESGLTGAFSLVPGFFSSKFLINLDSEAEGSITVSSAGGGSTLLNLPVTQITVSSLTGFNLTVNGLTGGHSGVDINKNRLNAIKVLNEGLINISSKATLNISTINGGALFNAIPSDAYCTFLVNESTMALNAYQAWQQTIDTYYNYESNLEIDLQEVIIDTVINSSDNVLSLLKEIPHGPLNFSKSFPNLVETSNNLAIIQTVSDSIEIITLTRSTFDGELERVRNQIDNLGVSLGAIVTQNPSFPSWPPDLNSSFLQYVQTEYEQIYGKEVELVAVHGGLETAVFKQLDSELQMVSIGPNIQGAHTPQERVYIKSVDLIWRVVRSILTNLNSIS